MLNDARVASACLHVRTCQRVRNGKNIATIRDFQVHVRVNSTIIMIIEDCKYNYTAEIKFGKSYSVALLWGKQILSSALNMLIYAN